MVLLKQIWTASCIPVIIFDDVAVGNDRKFRVDYDNMDLVDLQPQLNHLEENIDDLEEVIRPLLKNALSDTAANLPLLDKAKLYVLVVYSIESLLFCKNSRYFMACLSGSS